MFHLITTMHSEQDPLSGVIKSAVPYVFTTTQFVPIWAAIPIDFISIATAFVWNFLDVFILVISVGLSTQFQLFNDELLETQEVIF